MPRFVAALILLLAILASLLLQQQQQRSQFVAALNNGVADHVSIIARTTATATTTTTNTATATRTKARITKATPWWQQQLVLYDPRTGRQLQPLAYVPPILSGNKRQPQQQANGNVVVLPQLWNPCSCTELFCICCLGLRIGDDFINQRICAALQYNSAQALLRLTISLNQRTIANLDVPARNPAPWCLPVLLPLPVYGCLRLYDVRVGNGNVQLCITLMLNLSNQQLLQFPFDCVRFGVAGIALLPPSTNLVNINSNSNGVGVDGVPFASDAGNDAVDGATTTNVDHNGEVDGDVAAEDTLEVRENIQLEENYSGISVEQQQPFPIAKRARG